MSVAAEGAPRTWILSGIGGEKNSGNVLGQIRHQIPFSSQREEIQRLREFSWNGQVKSQGYPGGGAGIPGGNEEESAVMDVLCLNPGMRL